MLVRIVVPTELNCACLQRAREAVLANSGRESAARMQVFLLSKVAEREAVVRAERE
jgi:hypothetical protein